MQEEPKDGEEEEDMWNVSSRKYSFAVHVVDSSETSTPSCYRSMNIALKRGMPQEDFHDLSERLAHIIREKVMGRESVIIYW
jgi:hypothetical protein